MESDLVCRRWTRLAAPALFLLVTSALPAAPEADREELMRQMPTVELKRVYRACNRESLAGRLGGGAVMSCSVIYETLKKNAFGGDFERLLAWSQLQDLVPCPSADPHYPVGVDASQLLDEDCTDLE